MKNMLQNLNLFTKSFADRKMSIKDILINNKEVQKIDVCLLRNVDLNHHIIADRNSLAILRTEDPEIAKILDGNEGKGLR